MLKRHYPLLVGDLYQHPESIETQRLDRVENGRNSKAMNRSPVQIALVLDFLVLFPAISRDYGLYAVT